MPSGQRWETASEPRIEYDSSRDKFRLPEAVVDPKEAKDPGEAIAILHNTEGGRSKRELVGAKLGPGSQGVNVYPSNDPDRQSSPSFESAASATALPRGEPDKKFVSARSISVHFGKR